MPKLNNTASENGVEIRTKILNPPRSISNFIIKERDYAMNM